MPNLSVGTHLGFPFDAEVFNYAWGQVPDLELTAMLNSGAVEYDETIASLIANGSNLFTTPYYNHIGGDEEVYNGTNDITTSGITGGHMGGVVYGRQKGWEAISFIKDFNNGADPMQQIVNGVATWYNKKRQARIYGLIGAIMDKTDADMNSHKMNLASATATVTDANLIGETTIGNLVSDACGDNSGIFSLAIMHSKVANRLANLQLLTYQKYNDANGMQHTLNIASINGMTVIVTDTGTVRQGTNNKEYLTYVLGRGAIRYAKATVDTPSEMDRDPAKNGGKDFIYTRIRESLVPNGYSFIGDAMTDVGVPDAVLLASASWERKLDAKAVAMTRLITNG